MLKKMGLALAVGFFSTSTLAATETLYFGDISATHEGHYSELNASTASGVDVKISAYSMNTEGVVRMGSRDVKETKSPNRAYNPAQFQKAEVTYINGKSTFSSGSENWTKTTTKGLGVQNTGERYQSNRYGETDSEKGQSHSIDNVGHHDTLMLNFSEDVNLDKIKLAWASQEPGGPSYRLPNADLSILAYTGEGEPAPLETLGTFEIMATMNLNGANYASAVAHNLQIMQDAGWEIIPNPADSSVPGHTVGKGEYWDQHASYYSIGTEVKSSYWLVGAFNTAFGAHHNISGCDDAFLLAGIQFGDGGGNNGGNVPIPGSTALMGLGLLGLVYARRKKIAI